MGEKDEDEDEKGRDGRDIVIGPSMENAAL